MAGDFIGSAIETIGGFFGARDSERRQRLAQQNANDQNVALQKEFAQHGIRWRVEDAKAAGLHPLYALSGSGATFTPSVQRVTDGSRGFSEASQSLGRAVSAALSDDERDMNMARLRVLESEADKNFALAAAARSEEQRAWMAQWNSKPINFDGMGLKADPFWALSGDVRHVARSPSGGVGLSNDPTGPAGRVKPTPDEVVSARPGAPHLTAGRHTGFQEYAMPFGPMQLPRGDAGAGPAESMGEIPLSAWPGIIAENIRRYGPSWRQRFSRWIMGLDPEPAVEFRQYPSKQLPYKGGYGRGPGRSQ